MPSRSDPSTALSELAHQQISAALGVQRRALESMRNRSGTLLTGATISTSFLGGQALTRSSLGVLSWLAIGCFVVVAVVSLAILWPELDVELSANPGAAPPPRAPDQGDDDVAALHVRLVDHGRLACQRNEAHLARIATYLRIGVTFLTFEVLWWVADLATST